jgi:hypothetical protein
MQNLSAADQILRFALWPHFQHPGREPRGQTRKSTIAFFNDLDLLFLWHPVSGR